MYLALDQGKVTRHTKIKLRLPKGRALKGEGADEYDPEKGGIVRTTAGRVLFDDIVAEGMSFYNITMKSKDLARSSPTATSKRAGRTPSTCWTG